MAFFKKYNGTRDKGLQRFETITWLFIYGGLLALVLGYFVGRTAAAPAGPMYWGGSFSVLLGVAQIYLRSRLQEREQD